MSSFSTWLSWTSAVAAISLVAILLPVQGCRDAAPVASIKPKAAARDVSDHFVECQHGVVVSVSGPASDIGRVVLQSGGNAVDAAIATAFALQVTYPAAGNIAGGGFMLVHPAPGQGPPTSIDYRECAPAAAFATMYGKDESQYTHRAVAVPGTVRGLELAHRRFATQAWSQLIQPAIALARNGFEVDFALAKSINETLAVAPDFTELQRVYGKPGGGPWKAGDRLIQPDLARTLQLLADLGPDAFYTGPIAAALIAEMTRGTGLITADDLAKYRAVERKPVSTRYRGKYDVYAPAPPSSGGTCLIEELNMLEAFDLQSSGRWSPKTIHLMAEVMRRANYDRARYMGDPAFTEIPPRLTLPEYGRQLATTIDPTRATPSKSLSADIPLASESQDTTHFSIIDQQGMAVSNTFTLERRWGSRIVVKGMGFLLNNQMRAFNLVPGVTTVNGDVGTAANTIAPGKRPISSMTPTIVARDGRVAMVTGSPGSRAIPHTVLNILVSVLDYNIPVKMAVESPRFSQEWFPDRISWESLAWQPDTTKSLKEMGHTVVPPSFLPFQGDAHTIWVARPNEYVGVADRRISGKASGY